MADRSSSWCATLGMVGKAWEEIGIEAKPQDNNGFDKLLSARLQLCSARRDMSDVFEVDRSPPWLQRRCFMVIRLVVLCVFGKLSTVRARAGGTSHEKVPRQCQLMD